MIVGLCGFPNIDPLELGLEDIETLRRADFLVGSFQSNVYRLAAELNTAYHVDKYEWSVGAMNRIFPVDIEWYEDP